MFWLSFEEHISHRQIYKVASKIVMTQKSSVPGLLYIKELKIFEDDLHEVSSHSLYAHTHTHTHIYIYIYMFINL